MVMIIIIKTVVIKGFFSFCEIELENSVIIRRIFVRRMSSFQFFMIIFTVQ